MFIEYIFKILKYFLAIIAKKKFEINLNENFPEW